MISSNVDLKPFNTFGISANAKEFTSFSSIDELSEILKSRTQDKLLILGGGSNILFTKDFEGLVLKNEIKGFETKEISDDIMHVKVGAGVVWHSFVMKCIELDLGGVENLSLIPGNVGASPMQNIGAYGTEIKDVFVSLEAVNIETGELKSFTKDECAFGYRESVFKRALKGQYIIVNVTYQLTRRNHTIKTSYGAIQGELEKAGITNPTIKDVSDAVISIRSSKLPDPKEIGNAGSFFKNPVVEISLAENIKKNYDQFPMYPVDNNHVKLAAGWLIEQSGWKGKTFGNYGVHKNQALVLVNYSDAKGNEIYDLSEQIINDVKKKFGVQLEREVNIL